MLCTAYELENKQSQQELSLGPSSPFFIGLLIPFNAAATKWGKCGFLSADSVWAVISPRKKYNVWSCREGQSCTNRKKLLCREISSLSFLLLGDTDMITVFNRLRSSEYPAVVQDKWRDCVDPDVSFLRENFADKLLLASSVESNRLAPSE